VLWFHFAGLRLATSRHQSEDIMAEAAQVKTNPQAATLVSGLNEDLGREFQAIIRYTQFAASIEGPYRPQIAELFRREISDELTHVHFLADKIAALGGEPTTFVPPVETSHDVHEMLEMVAAAEREDVETYTRRAREAEQAGEVGLKVQLENIVLDETRHLEEVKKILAGWRAPFTR
jgi:bacterioferritin